MNKIENLSLDSFSPICVLGKGSYAHVLLVEAEGAPCHNETTKNFALKMLDKTDIEFAHSQSTVFKEREILLKLRDCHFVTQLQACFQGQQEVSFLMEFCPGGDLFERMIQSGPFREEQARFYVGQIAIALDEIHSKQVVYRDLKPENLVFDSQGYLKLADFGCSELRLEGLSGMVGTPQYMAPEMIHDKTTDCGYDFRVDFWALGCLMFELLTGRAPFVHKNPKKLQHAITHDNLVIPNNISSEANDLITKLLQKDPNLRMTLADLKQHSWFKNFQWDSVANKSVQAPWKPQTDQDFGIGNFNKKFIEMEFEGINCGMSEGLWLENFYYESDQLDWVPRVQLTLGDENSENLSSFEETEDEEFGKCGDFSDFDWTDSESEASWD